jgi:hypothetical protein
VADWEKSKKHRHSCRLPTSIELAGNQNEANSLPDTFVDYERAAEVLHKKIKPLLTASEWQIYDCLYIRGLSEEETAKELGFKSNETHRKPGYNRMTQVKIKSVKIARQLLQDDGIETIEYGS